MKHYMIVDMGTGNSRVALVREDGRLICVKSFENVYYIDDAYEDAQYFDPSYWKRNILDLCREVIREHPDIIIDAISSSGARETIVLINHEQEDFYGLPNIDNRGREWMSKIQQDGIYEKTGRWVTEDFPAAKLMGLQKRRKQLFDQVQTFTSLSEWIGYVLCGKIAIEPSQACETQLYDIVAHQWSEELLERFGLQKLTMPRLMEAGSLLGYVKEELKQFLGITYDIPFIVGGADTHRLPCWAPVSKKVTLRLCPEQHPPWLHLGKPDTVIRRSAAGPMSGSRTACTKLKQIRALPA